MNRHDAPWGKPLAIVSSLATVVCLSISFVTMRDPANPGFWFGLLPLAFVAGCALFTVRGYSIVPGALLVHRLLWATRVPLDGLQSAKAEPGAMCRSLRTWGNGGFFSFTGFYRSKALGPYRAYVTDLRRTVVLRFDGRTIVVSPADPEGFARELAEAAGCSA